MELLPLLCLCVLTRAGTTFADQHGPEIIIVTEGSHVTLPCSTSEDIGLRRFEWKKDDQKEVFVYDGSALSGQDEQFKGRVSYFSGELKNGNASITIRDTKRTDSGDYTCEIRLKDLTHQKFHIKLLVGAAPAPSITKLEETQDWVLLQCEVHGASPKPKVQWQDRAGNILPAKEPHVSERGGSYDIILQTTVTKTDHYRCVATQEEINHQIHAETYVHMNGAAQKPYVTILEETKDWVQLQCEVHGASPKPKVQWQDGAGNILPAKEPQVSERGGSYDIILQTTVTKTDHYRCVATQEEINHQIHAEIHVYISGSQTGWIVAALVFGTLFVGGVIILILLKKKGYITRHPNTGGAQTRVPHEDPNHLV